MSFGIPLSGWCVRGGVVQRPIPEVVNPLHVSLLLKDGMYEILVNRLFCWVCLQRFCRHVFE